MCFGTLFFCFGNSKTATRFYCAKHFFENTLRVLSTKLKSSSQWDSCKYEKEYMIFETDNHTVHQWLFNRIRNFSRYFLLLLDHYNTQHPLSNIYAHRSHNPQIKCYFCAFCNGVGIRCGKCR